MPVEGSVRDRRRAETVQEIKDAALTQLAQSGTGGLSLRAVARAVGMTVQSLYHYFDSRDALLTVLVTDAHHELADAVQAAADASRGRPPRDRLIAAANAYRSWALANRSAFLLIYGTPVPDFEPHPDAGSGSAALRLSVPFVDVVFDGWSDDELAAVPLLPGSGSLTRLDDEEIALPIGALVYFFELRAGMHGMVMLELLGHLYPFQATAAVFFASAIGRISDGIAAMRASVRPR